tara:strand:+ start:81 stop:482 length:402 start_codon:yes stop_codon:yes gene_type:complete
MIKEKVKWTSVPEDLVVEIKINGAALQRLKILLQSYLQTESQEKQMQTLLAASWLVNPANQGTKEVEEIEKKIDDDIFYQNIITLYTMIGTIEAEFIKTGKTETQEQEVEMSKEAHEHLKEIRSTISKAKKKG